mgnify:FL=1
MASYGALALAILALAIMRALLRHRDRVEPRVISAPSGFSLRRPFASLGWRYEPLAADLFIILAVTLLVARGPIGEALFTTPSGKFSPGVIDYSWFEALFSPFIGSFSEGFLPEEGRTSSLWSPTLESP